MITTCHDRLSIQNMGFAQSDAEVACRGLVAFNCWGKPTKYFKGSLKEELCDEESQTLKLALFWTDFEIVNQDRNLSSIEAESTLETLLTENRGLVKSDNKLY